MPGGNMAVAEVKADELFVGLDHAETRLPTAWFAACERASRLAVILLLGAAQIAWVATLGYLALLFLRA